MRDNLYTGVERAFSAAAKHRDVVAKIKKQAQADPELLATKVVSVVPECLKRNRAIGLEDFGLDVTDTEAVKNFKPSSVGEWQMVCRRASYHQIYSGFLYLVGQFATDPNLVGVRSAQAVCEAFIEATERYLYAVALDFEQLQRSLPSQEFPTEELLKVLTGIVATRTSLEKNVSLRAAIDERREHSAEKSAKRERFEQLLMELPGAVLGAWKEMPRNPGNLDDVRTEAARQLDRRTTSEEATQRLLAEFELRETALEEYKEINSSQRVGLSERELQVWYLDEWLDEEVGRNTKLKARVISAILGGVAASTIRRHRKRYKDKFKAFKRTSEP
jgi:hypothetical protein